MSEMCRVCCVVRNDLVSIFSTDNSLQISFKVMSLASVRILEGDSLPSLICKECLCRLNNSYEFKIQCEKTDLKLRRKLLPDTISYEHYVTEENGIKNELYTESLPSVVKCEVEYNNGDTENIVKDDEDFANKTNKGIDLYKNTKIKKSIAARKLNRGAKRARKKSLIDNDDEDDLGIEPATKSMRTRSVNKLANNGEERTKREPISSSTQCYTCGKVVSSRFRLKCHMRTHTGERPFNCQYCNKPFALAYNLKVHERIHTGEKPLLCGICGKTFAQSAGLVAHMRLHTGETPYKCPLCPAAFKTCSHLQYHVRLHTGEKNHECQVCNRAFITKGDLTQHHKTHTGERAHVCSVCGLRLTRSYHLTRHMLTHTGEKPHRCYICGSAYAQKGDLVRHIKKHNNDNITANMTQTELHSKGVPITNELEVARMDPRNMVETSRVLADARIDLNLGLQHQHRV